MLRRIRNKVDQLILGKTKSRYLDFIIHHHENDALLNEFRKAGEGIYEEHETPIMVEVLRKFKKPMLLDVGANIGLMTLNACAFVEDAKVFAIEPGPSQFDLLKRNIESNGLGHQVSVFNLALSASEGEVDFYVHERMHSSGDGMIDTGRAGDASVIKVKSCTLDTWWESNSKPDVSLMKIDTEGAELQILENARNFITTCRPYMLIEMCDLNFLKYGRTYQEHLDFFASMNYDVIDTQSQKRIVKSDDIQPGQYYYLTIPREK